MLIRPAKKERNGTGGERATVIADTGRLLRFIVDPDVIVSGLVAARRCCASRVRIAPDPRGIWLPTLDAFRALAA
jgi:hypothetical protein